MTAAYLLPDPYGFQTYGGNWRQMGTHIRERRESRKWPVGYVMLRTGITTQRLEAIERGAVTATDAEVERLSAVLQDR